MLITFHEIILFSGQVFGVLVFQWGVFRCQRFHAGRRLLLEIHYVLCFVSLIWMNTYTDAV